MSKQKGKRKSDEQKAIPAKVLRSLPMKRRALALRPEVKFHDTAITLASALALVAGRNYTGANTVGCELTQIPVGTDRINRIGREVFITRLTVRAQVESDGATPCRYRCIIFSDNEAQASLSTEIENVYKTRLANQIDMNTLREMGQSDRFRVLYNQMSPSLVDTGSAMDFRHNWDIDVPVNQKVRFPSAATTLPNNFALYIVYVADFVQAAGFNPSFTHQCRIKFLDQ